MAQIRSAPHSRQCVGGATAKLFKTLAHGTTYGHHARDDTPSPPTSRAQRAASGVQILRVPQVARWMDTCIGRCGRVCSHGPAAWLRSRDAVPVFASPGLLGSQAVRVQIEPLSLAPQKRAQGPFPESLAARGAKIPRLGSFGLLAWLHIG